MNYKSILHGLPLVSVEQLKGAESLRLQGYARHMAVAWLAHGNYPKRKVIQALQWVEP